MEQISYEQICAPECVEYKVCLENLIEEGVKNEFMGSNIKQVKINVSKEFKKADLNAKYLEELRSIKFVRAQMNYRRYGVF